MTLREEVLHDMHIDMHKSYDSLEHVRCQEILVEYVMGNLALRLLWRCWYRLAMWIIIDYYLGC